MLSILLRLFFNHNLQNLTLSNNSTKIGIDNMRTQKSMQMSYTEQAKHQLKFKQISKSESDRKKFRVLNLSSMNPYGN